MIYRIRIADIPVFIIAMVIMVPLLLGFIKLAETNVIDVRGFPSWLFTILFLGFICVCVWIAGAIWKRIKRVFQR